MEEIWLHHYLCLLPTVNLRDLWRVMKRGFTVATEMGFFFSLNLDECFESGQIPSLITCDKDTRCILENYF